MNTQLRTGKSGKPMRLGEQAFSRTDLTAAIAVVLLLLCVWAPVLGQSRVNGPVVCLENMRRLSEAWLSYSMDHNGKLVDNVFGQIVRPQWKPWVTGWLDWSSRPDNTNTLYLNNTEHAALAAYLRSDASVYKCPADIYVSPPQLALGWTERVRSYSMNASMGDGPSGRILNSGAQTIYRNLDEIVTLAPSQAFVFLEEHPDSINDVTFMVNLKHANWPDLPGSYHDGAAAFSFADGHVELKRWEDPRTIKSVDFGIYNRIFLNQNNVDWRWVASRASAPPL